MANCKAITKPRGQPQPAKPIGLRWKDRGIPGKPEAQRRMLREISKMVDDKAVFSILYWGLSYAVSSDERADPAELAHIKATCAIIPGKRVPVSELIPLKRRARG